MEISGDLERYHCQGVKRQQCDWQVKGQCEAEQKCGNSSQSLEYSRKKQKAGRIWT